MAKLFKALSIIIFGGMIAFSVYAGSQLYPVYTGFEQAYNSQYASGFKPSGFNIWLFIAGIIVSLFLFCAVWCYGNIAEAAKKYLKAPERDASSWSIPPKTPFDSALFGTNPCKKCGHENAADETTCRNCGAKLDV